MFRDAVLNGSSLVRRDLPLHFLNDRGQARFRVGRNCKRRCCSPSAATSSAAATTSTTRAWSNATESDVRDIAAEQRGQGGAGDGGLSARGFQAQRVIIGRVETGTTQRMALRETHWPVRRGCAGARTYQFRKFHGGLHTLRRPQTTHGNSGILCID